MTGKSGLAERGQGFVGIANPYCRGPYGFSARSAIFCRYWTCTFSGRNNQAIGAEVVCHFHLTLIRVIFVKMDWRRWASIARLSIRKMCCPNGSRKLLTQKIMTTTRPLGPRLSAFSPTCFNVLPWRRGIYYS